MTTVAPAFSVASPAAAGTASQAGSADGFTFHDLLSIVNPLQHLPIVSTIYRAVTGDKIGNAERIAGDTLYGGFWGFVSSVANVAYQEVTGHDLGEQVLAFAESLVEPSGQATEVASAPDPVKLADAASVAPQLIRQIPEVNTQDVTPTELAAILPQLETQIPSFASSAPMLRGSDTLADDSYGATAADGVDPAIAQRALAAYRRSVAAQAPSAQPVF